MPAQMISDDDGGSAKVNGSRMAMVVIGAMPGSTPTSVPISAPMKQNSRLAGVSEVAKPVARLWIRSIGGSPRPDRNRQPQHRNEQNDGEGRQRDGEDHVLLQLHVISGVAGAQHNGEARQREPGKRQQHGEQRN